MSRTRKTNQVETDRLRQQAAELGHLLSEQAGKAGATAASLAEQGRLWATTVATPTLDKAWRDSVRVTAPRIEAAVGKASPAMDTAHSRIVEDYIPRLQKALQDAVRAAAGEPLDPKAAKAAAKAAARAKAAQEGGAGGGSVVKTVGWILVGTAAAGTGYLLWRRTQPVDDPWAEEYWDDTTVTSTVSSDDVATDEGSDLSGVGTGTTAASTTGTTPLESVAVDAEIASDSAGGVVDGTGDESQDEDRPSV